MSGDEQAIDTFRTYLRIRTEQPSPDYHSCRLGAELGMDVRTVELVPGKPVVLMTLCGSDPRLPSILLNSHTDVVPVTAEKWTHAPFAAEMTPDGRIYARGSQDMKCVGIGYFEAIRRLRASGRTLRRTVHLSFVPDEEIGGRDGMAAFAASEQFRSLNVGFALDEGVPTPHQSLLLFNGERLPWWIKIAARGNAGHGSAFVQGTAAERLLAVLTAVQAFRAQQILKLAASDNELRDCGRITSVNITMIQAGKQVNVVPDEAVAYLDIRVAEDYGVAGVLALLEEWTSAEGVSYAFEQRSEPTANTVLDPADPWWAAVSETLRSMYSCCTRSQLLRGLAYDVAIFPGASDARFLRALGIPALGLSPFRNTPLLIHDHDEYMGREAFLDGICIYAALIGALTA